MDRPNVGAVRLDDGVDAVGEGHRREVPGQSLAHSSRGLLIDYRTSYSTSTNLNDSWRAPMSDHFDASDLRTDITDLYVFPGLRVDRTVLVLDVNPEPSTAEASVDPAASYEIKIDTDGDMLTDVAFHVLFESEGGSVTANVYRAKDTDAQGTGPVGEAVIKAAPVSVGSDAQIADADGYRFFAGVRSDPHFKDILGFRNDFQFTGDDPVAKRNVFGIVLEVPNHAFGAEGTIRVWARTMGLLDGEIVQLDQAGRPGINNAFNTEDEDNAAFCRSSPLDQRADFGDKFIAFLRSLGYPDAEATELGRSFLPDWVVYNPSEPSGYPNGRRLTDDTADLLAALLTRGRITNDLAGPHTDYLPDFPYLGPPHPDPIGVV